MAHPLARLSLQLLSCPPTSTAASRADAAVTLVLRDPESGVDPELLLVQRARSIRDPWSGHMALPGGRWSPGDGSLLHTAMRETLEETAVDLSDGLDDGFLGWLPAVSPRSVRLPQTRVSPAVFRAPAGTTARVNSHELASVHWVQLSLLSDPRCRDRHELPPAPDSSDRPPGSAPKILTPCIRVDERPVWGLTYRILMEFLDRAGLVTR